MFPLRLPKDLCTLSYIFYHHEYWNQAQLGSDKGEPNHALIRAIVTAQAWVEENKAGQSVSDIMQAQSIPEGMIWKRMRPAFLSPNILKAIAQGTTNRKLSIKMLTQHDLSRE